MTTDEAATELTKALGQSTGTTRLAGTVQETNLLKSLDTLEEGNLESQLESSLTLSSEEAKTKNAVDATLEEI